MLAKFGILFAVTRSEKGSVIVNGDVVVKQAAANVDQVIDTTGAGDAYAAGFLYGWANDRTLSECAHYGTYCATKVIQQVGGRIEKGLLDEFA
jgi:sugar/nucleoside kinase (ribokinase family)